MASITWAVSGGRVVEIVDGQMRATDISVADYNAGKLPYGQIVGEPFTLVPHQDSPTNFDVSTRIVPWLEDIYRGEPLPGVQPTGTAGQLTSQYENEQLDPNSGTTIFDPKYWMPIIVAPPTPNTPSVAATPSGVGVNTGTGAPKPLAVVGPPDVFIGGSLGSIRLVGPGPLVGEGSGIRMGILPRVILGDSWGE